jgi:hypothetical protein
MVLYIVMTTDDSIILIWAILWLILPEIIFLNIVLNLYSNNFAKKKSLKNEYTTTAVSVLYTKLKFSTKFFFAMEK